MPMQTNYQQLSTICSDVTKIYQNPNLARLQNESAVASNDQPDDI